MNKNMFITFTHVNWWHMRAFILIINANQTSFSMFMRSNCWDIQLKMKIYKHKEEKKTTES